MNKPHARTHRRIRRVTACVLACAGWHAALADVALTVDDGPIGGRVTLEPGSDRLTIQQPQGEARSVALMDVDVVRFGEELVVVRDGNLLLINNDKPQQMHRKSASIKLRAGLHRFVLPYWQGEAQLGLQLRVAGPGIAGEVEAGSDHLVCFRATDQAYPASPGIDADGFRMPELSLDDAQDRRRFLTRARYRLYVGDQTLTYQNVGVLDGMQLKRSGTTTSIGVGMVNNPSERLGLVFEGFFRAPQDGEYQFSLVSDDGSQLYLGAVDRFQAQALATPDGPTPWRVELALGGIARGELDTIADEQATMSLPMGDASGTAMTLPLGQVVALWDQRVGPEAVSRANEPGDLDTVYIRDKDNPADVRPVSGRLLALDTESLTFAFRGRPRTIARERVAGLVLNHADRPAMAPPGFYQAIRLRTGQVLAGRLTALGERASVELIGGGSIEFPREALDEIRSENGRRVGLTRIAPTAEETIPYFGFSIPHRVNETFDGGAVRLFDDNTYERALVVHSMSRLHYKLDTPCERLRATFGLLNPSGKLGDVTARVIGDGEVLWQQTNITAATGAVPVDVELAGVERLILEVDFGGGQDVGDRAAWCEPQLIRSAQP